MATLNVEIVTPEQVRYNGQAVSLTLPGSEGQMGMLAHHAPIVALLDPGILRVDTGAESRIYASGEGFVQMRNNKATVIVSFADAAADIKLEEAQKALTEAERALSTPDATDEVRRRHTNDWKAAQARVAVKSGAGSSAASSGGSTPAGGSFRMVEK
jgi:F-type H+-transporting ATPase subunit epsilon